MRRMFFAAAVAGILIGGCQTNSGPAIQDMSGAPPAATEPANLSSQATPPSVAATATPVSVATQPGAAPVAVVSPPPATIPAATTVGARSSTQEVDAYFTWFNDFTARRVAWKRHGAEQIDQMNNASLSVLFAQRQQEYAGLVTEFRNRPTPPECARLSQMFSSLMAASWSNESRQFNRIIQDAASLQEHTQAERDLETLLENNEEVTATAQIQAINQEIAAIYRAFPYLKTPQLEFSFTRH